VQRFPHATLAGSTEVIPTVIHKGDTAIDRSANNPDSQLLINVLQAEVPTPNPIAETLSPVLPRVRYSISEFDVLSDIFSPCLPAIS
jgi:hypothetical protein